MTTAPAVGPAPVATSAQLAVRWHVVVGAALLLASVPIVHLVWHVLLGHDVPVIRTRGQAAAPPPTAANVFDGSWMPAKERELQEASPIVWWLRSGWNEALYRAGLPRSAHVHFGRDEWFFLQATVRPDRELFLQRREVRRRFFTAVRDRVRAAGAELFVSLVPDKARLHPELAFADGVLPGAVQPNYGEVLAELHALGIPTVDLVAAVATARAAAPAQELWFRRDTHWRPEGALVAAQAIAAAIEAGPIGARLSPRVQVELFGKETIRLIGDLTAMCGLGTIEAEAGHALPMSLLTERLAEDRSYYGIVLRDQGRPLPLHGDTPDAEVVVAGTSFAIENGWKALSVALGRPVRAVEARGAGGTEPIRTVLRQLDDPAVARPRLVIWEIVERGLFEPEWRDPRP